MVRMPTTRPAVRQRGASIIEVMVGLLIGLIVVAVIYNTLIVAEGFRRSTLGVADAQVTGQLSQFIVGRELSNAGNGVMSVSVVRGWRRSWFHNRALGMSSQSCASSAPNFALSSQKLHASRS